MERQQILVSALAGDDDALGVLVRTYHAQLLRVGLRACRNQFDADDAVQEAFIRLARRPELTHHTSVLGWLVTVVRRACLRLLRRGSLATRYFGEAVDADSAEETRPLEDELLERYRISELVRGAIAKLPEAQRAVLILRDIEGLSGPEVCASLAISEASMKSRLHRARAELRERLQLAL